MSEIGLRELKTRASEIVRQVKERRQRYVVTVRGRPAALLVPLEDAEGTAEGADAWEELVRLGEEIGCNWQVPQSSAELISEMRR
jgi:prevent-host-death family protein